MRPTRGWRRTLRVFRTPAEEVREEIQAHLEARADQLEARGVGREEAERRARDELGDPAAAARSSLKAAGPAARWRLVARLRWFAEDLRFALRSLRRKPTFGCTVVGVLAPVIAVNAVVVAVVSAYLLRALPYPEADRVAFVTRTPVGGATMSPDAPVPGGLNSIDWPRRDSVMEYSAAWELDGFGLLSGGDPEVVGGAWVTAGFFPITGARARLGRLFDDSDVEQGAPVAVISHGLWLRRFGGEEGIIGRTIGAFSNDRPDDAETFEIVGVLHPDFWTFATGASDLFVPLRGTRRPVLVRLREGVSREQAELHLTSIARARLPEVHPTWRMHVTPLQRTLYRELAPSLRLLWGTALLVLVIAAANLAVLLLIRTRVREQELSIRSALGAGRGRIFRQLAVEGLFLAGSAAAVGLGLAHLALEALAPTIQSVLGAPAPGGPAGLALDGRTWALTAAACLGLGVLFGLVPVLARRPGSTLLHSSRGSPGGRHRTARDVLVGVEVALSLSLLVGAGLLFQGIRELDRLEIGFEPEGLVQASVALRERSYPDGESRIRFFDRVLDQARTTTGARRAAITSRYPFQYSRGDRLEAAGVDPAVNREVRAVHHTVSEGYLAVMGIPLLSGRGFGPQDDPRSEPVVIVSRRLADRLWPDGPAIGRRVRLGSWRAVPDGLDEAPWRRVVGVADDVRTTRTGEDHPDTYVPYRQDPQSHMHLIVRAPGAAEAEALSSIAAGLRSAVAAVDPRQPATVLDPMQEVVSAELTRPRFLAGLLGTFAGFAVVLTLVGLHAVVGYAAEQRRREVAIRLALGARRSEVLGMFLRQASRTILAGAVVGLIGAWGLGQAVRSQLYGVSPVQPIIYTLLALGTLAVALLAVWLTARRAARTEPAALLREG